MRLLIDAGVSGIRTESRLAMHGIDIRSVDAVLISHDHADHVSAMGALHRKYGLPVYITPATFEYVAGTKRPGRFSTVHFFEAGEVLSFGRTSVETLPTPHDGVDASVFVVCVRDKRLGILTDLGCVTPSLRAVVRTLDAVYLESNYDDEMLENGPYPARLKVRIKGQGGHISNLEAASLLRESRQRLQWACLSHLSGENNSPEIALQSCRAHLPEDFPLFAASRTAVGDMHFI